MKKKRTVRFVIKAKMPRTRQTKPGWMVVPMGGTKQSHHTLEEAQEALEDHLERHPSSTRYEWRVDRVTTLVRTKTVASLAKNATPQDFDAWKGLVQ